MSTARRQRLILPLSLGIADGILNALILSSAAILYGRGLTFWLAARVGLVALVTSVFTVFVAEYAQLRADLVRAEHQLNLTASGRLAAGVLGQQVIREAAQAAGVASGASFAGAVIPLLIGVAARPYGWIALVAAVAALGALGASVSAAIGGRRVRWTVLMVVAGSVVAIVGTWLNLS